MEQVGISRFADIVGVTLAEARSSLAEALAIAGDDALEVHGELKGRGFVARRTRAVHSASWRFMIETPRQIMHEAGPALEFVPAEANSHLLEAMTRISTLAAAVAELAEQLRLVERRAGEERQARLLLERRIEAVDEQCERHSALLDVARLTRPDPQLR
jgi:hypothetical protein